MKIALLVSPLFALLSTPQNAAGGSSDQSSIAGVHAGDRLEDARACLDKIGKTTGRPAETETPGSLKEAWALDSTEFATVALKTDAERRVVWITGFIRPGREIPFDKLGPLRHAKPTSSGLAIWDRINARPPYRVIARGSGQMARVVSLISIGATKDESAEDKD